MQINQLYRYSSKKFFLLFVPVLVIQIIDAVVGNLSDILKDFTVSPIGISSFVIMAIIAIIGQYLLVGMAKNKSSQQIVKKIHFDTYRKSETIIQHSVVILMTIVLFQILFYSEYSVFLIKIAVFTSFGFAVYSMASLTGWFLKWFKIKKNFILLLFSMASLFIVFHLLSMIVLTITILDEKTYVINSKSDVIFDPNLPGTLITLSNSLHTYFGIIAFILFWSATVVLLRHNIYRIGKTKFWILMSTPIVAFSGYYLVFFQSIAGTPSILEDPINGIVIPVLIIIFTGIIAIIIIGISFSFIAKPLKNNTMIRDFLTITSYGFILFFATTLTSIGGAGFPPYGLINLILVGPFSFLIVNSLYRSAIAVSEDVELRRFIKNTANRELDLLDDMGTAQMYQQLEDNIMEASKSNAFKLSQQTGIEPSLTDEEIKYYLKQVVMERQISR